MNRGLIQRDGRKIGLGYPPIFAVESLTLARRGKNYFWRCRFGECGCNRLLAGVYKRANKELAHLTATFNDEFNEDDVVDEAAKLVEQMLNAYLYTVVGEKMPKIDA